MYPFVNLESNNVIYLPIFLLIETQGLIQDDLGRLSLSLSLLARLNSMIASRSILFLLLPWASRSSKSNRANICSCI